MSPRTSKPSSSPLSITLLGESDVSVTPKSCSRPTVTTGRALFESDLTSQRSLVPFSLAFDCDSGHAFWLFWRAVARCPSMSSIQLYFLLSRGCSSSSFKVACTFLFPLGLLYISLSLIACRLRHLATTTIISHLDNNSLRKLSTLNPLDIRHP